MTKRIVEISSEGCYVHLKLSQLVLERKGEEIGTIPIEDLSVLILDNPQILITQACLRKLLNHNVMVISCDGSHQPSGLFLPLQSNTLQAERFIAQALMPKPLKKQLWKQVVVSKVEQQHFVLTQILGRENTGILPLTKKVRSGDPTNIEGQAARRYWSKIFTGNNFRRDRDAKDQNRYLNYGYAVLRAITARAICATGLHPTLGIHHHNRYNAYCLADDLMEPYRPIVDLKVYRLVNEFGGKNEMSQEIRSQLLAIVKETVIIAGEQFTLQGAIQKTVQSLMKAILENKKQLVLPQI